MAGCRRFTWNMGSRTRGDVALFRRSNLAGEAQARVRSNRALEPDFFGAAWGLALCSPQRPEGGRATHDRGRGAVERPMMAQGADGTTNQRPGEIAREWQRIEHERVGGEGQDLAGTAALDLRPIALGRVRSPVSRRERTRSATDKPPRSTVSRGQQAVVEGCPTRREQHQDRKLKATREAALSASE